MILIGATGCSTVPFQRGAYVPEYKADPQKVRREFASAFPERIQAVNSVVFQYKLLKFSALGYIDVNTGKKTFAVSCMNPVGVKFFELSGDSNSVKPVFVLPFLSHKGDVPGVVGEDIRRIYFDSIPSAKAAVEKKRFRIVFSEPRGPGVVKYVFAGSQNALIEKSYYENNRCLWSVFYYEYRSDRGKLYPAGTVYKNYRFGYELIIRVKEKDE